MAIDDIEAWLQMAFSQSAALQVVDGVILFRYTLNHIFNAQTFTLYRQK